MKIAVIAPTAMPARRANTIQTAKMAQAFVRLGHEVLLIAIPSSTPYSWQSFAHHYGITTPFEIAWLKPVPFLRRYDFALRSVIQAMRWGADLLYTRLPQASALSSLLGFPTIFEVHDMPQGGAARLFRLFLLGRGARRLVTISAALADALQEAFSPLAQRSRVSMSQPFHIIAPDGVDIERYTPLLSKETARQTLEARGIRIRGDFLAGYSGHLYPGRGIELLLQLAERLPEVTFLLVGGEENDILRLKETLREQALDNVNLMGFVPNAELPLYQMACDVLLMPYQEHVSASSGGDIAPFLSPMKLFEYLACGRPILSSDLKVFHEILTAENAVLLPPQDVEAWADALNGLRQAPEKCVSLGQNARTTAEKHTWEIRAAQIIALPDS